MSHAKGQGDWSEHTAGTGSCPAIPTVSSWLLSPPSRRCKHPGCVWAASKTRCKRENVIVRQRFFVETDDFSQAPYLSLFNPHYKPREGRVWCCGNSPAAWLLLLQPGTGVPALAPAVVPQPRQPAAGWHRLPQPKVFQALRPNSVKVVAVQFPNVVWERREN